MVHTLSDLLSSSKLSFIQAFVTVLEVVIMIVVESELARIVYRTNEKVLFASPN